MNSKQSKIAQNVIALIILIILTATLYIFLFNKVPDNSREKVLDTIFSKVTIENGSVAISLDVTLDFPSSLNYTIKELESVTEYSLRNLDYSQIESSETINYLKSEIEKGLKKTYPELNEEKINIYITDFKSGHLAEAYKSEKGNSGNDKIYKGLFKGIK